MKIGKLTLDGYYNYGNVLQNYALRQVLLRYAEVVDSLWHEQDRFMVRTWHKWSWKEPVKYLINWRGFRNELLSDFHGMEMVRQGRIKEWCDRYIGIKRAADLSKIADDYDYFVVGSDQVWNHALVHGDAAYFLDFVPPEKRCSYAASFGISEIPEEERSFYQEHLQGYHNYSTREATGARLVQELTGQQATVDLDPVFLPGVSRWEQLLQPIERRPYIFLYMPLDASLAVARQLAAQQHLDIVYVAYNKSIRHPERNPGDCRIAVAPEEFLSLLYHAHCVVTGSFHATVFSVLFHKPFYTSVPERIGSRITDVLHLLSLSDHIIQHGQVPSASEPDWGRVDARVTALRTESLQHLKESLGLA